MKRRGRYYPRRFVPDDDVQGKLREEIIAEHLAWMENKQREPPPDFSEYPLVQWLNNHRKSLAQRKSRTCAHSYLNTKSRSKRDRSKP